MKDWLMKCKKHPTYKTVRPPRSKCLTCWLMWNNKQHKIIDAMTRRPSLARIKRINQRIMAAYNNQPPYDEKELEAKGYPFQF